MKVKLRSKLTKQGYSLYLDLYKNGKREFEFLDTYVSEDYTSKKGLKNIKSQDKENMILAREICNQTQTDLNSLEHGIIPPNRKNADFLVYFDMCYKERKKAHIPFLNTLKHLKKFAAKPLPISNISITFLNNFSHYLKSLVSITSNTVVTYMNRLKQVLDECVKDNIISQNPFKQFDMKALNRETVEPEIDFLTIEELRLLQNVKTRANINVHGRKAFLFACFTGLRISDIKKLQWSDIQNGAIRFIQKKKRTREDVPFYTTSKLLGHTNLQSTQVYAKVVDHLKNDAVSRYLKSDYSLSLADIKFLVKNGLLLSTKFGHI